MRFYVVFVLFFGFLFADSVKQDSNDYLESYYKKGITQSELERHFSDFLRDFPVLKFSGVFIGEDNKTGLHISHCDMESCEVGYNDFSAHSGDKAIKPECRSKQKLRIIDANHAIIGDTALKITDDVLQIYGEIAFDCDPLDVADVSATKSANTQFNKNYEIVLKDSIFRAHFNYPLNLNCLDRGDFSAQQVCVEPSLSDMYSFGQFFIYLANMEPESFHAPTRIFRDYKIMQSQISVCEHNKRKEECIYAALGRFESRVRDNLIIDSTPPQILAHYKLLR